MVEHTGNVGMSSALALDPADHPVIVYHKVAEGVLKTAWWTGTQWLYQDLEQIGTLAPSYTSLLVAADGIPHVAYYDVAAGDLKYARGLSALPTAAWEITTVDSAGDVGGYASLARNAAGQPRISYVDWTNAKLKYAEMSGTGWHIDTVADIGSAGYNSLALNRHGEARIAFYDDQQADLVLAVRDPLGAGAAGWDLETVNSAGDVGAYPALALDRADRTWISYYDATNADLKCAEGEPAIKRSICR